MKNILLLILLFSGFAYGQADKSRGYSADSIYSFKPISIDSMPGFYNGGGTLTFYPLYWSPMRVISTYDTTVLYEGAGRDCPHQYVAERKPLSLSGCLVNHGVTGCPDGWMDEKQICTICLRHIRIKETRTAQPVQDEYAEAVKRLEALKPKQ